MALDVYFREDILNILRATYVASEGTSTLLTQLLDDPDFHNVPIHKLMDIYRRGFVTALGSVGLAFGLDAVEEEKEKRVTRSMVSVPEQKSLPQSHSGQSNTVEGQQSLSDYDYELFSFLWTRARRTRERG